MHDDVRGPEDRLDGHLRRRRVLVVGLREYEAKPSAGIITRAGVAKLLFGNFKGYIDHALCNDIPKATLAPLDTTSTYECEVVDKGRKPTGIATSTVRATKNGPRAY
ncbi:hypothetical protein AB0M97_20635 [Streptomyces sp. NPDC051207]|uniref:hypothetical protein n=1 Tax=Streptomyces sp. NPDC051207 TaxID=3154641 RepID=UPI003448EEAB